MDEQCGIVFYRCIFFFQAEDGIRNLVRSRGLGDVYKRQSYLSGAKMKALKPEIDRLKEKHGDDKQAFSMDQMLSLIHI